jgi:hypothetical protein
MVAERLEGTPVPVTIERGSSASLACPRSRQKSSKPDLRRRSTTDKRPCHARTAHTQAWVLARVWLEWGRRRWKW